MQVKSLGLLLICVYMANISLSQTPSFQGTITYNVIYQAQKAGYDIEALQTLWGNKQIFHIQKDQWATYHNGFSAQPTIYSTQQNKIYRVYPNKKIAVIYDGQVFLPKIKKSYLDEQVINILGIPCQALVIETEKDKIYYYYNIKYKVDTYLFHKNAIDPLMYMWQKTQGAIPLGQIIMKENYSVIFTATSINRESPSPNIFQIPADYERIPSAQGMSELELSLLQQYATRRIKYPKSAVKKGIEGTVFVELLVNEENFPSQIDIIKGICPDCDRQVRKIARHFPHWRCGRRKGRPAKIIYVVPIYFTLD